MLYKLRNLCVFLSTALGRRVVHLRDVHMLAGAWSGFLRFIHKCLLNDSTRFKASVRPSDANLRLTLTRHCRALKDTASNPEKQRCALRAACFINSLHRSVFATYS